MSQLKMVKLVLILIFIHYFPHQRHTQTNKAGTREGLCVHIYGEPLALLLTFDKMFFLLILSSVVDMKSFASFKQNLAAIFAFFGLLYI